MDEVTRHCVGIDTVDVEVGLALARGFVEGLAHFEDGGFFLILIVLVVVIVVIVVVIVVVAILVVVIVVRIVLISLRRLLARNAIMGDDTLAGVRQSLAIVELFVDTIGRSKGACLVHEDTQKNGLAIGRAVRSNEEFNILLTIVVAIVVVTILVIVAIILVITIVITIVIVATVGVVLGGILVDFEFLAFHCFLKIEFFFLLATVVIVIVIIVLFDTGVVDAGGDVALGLTCLCLFERERREMKLIVRR